MWSDSGCPTPNPAPHSGALKRISDSPRDDSRLGIRAGGTTGRPEHSLRSSELPVPGRHPLVAADALALPSGDRAEAQRLLDELAAEGKPLAFTYLVPQNNQANRTGEYIATQLRGFKNISVTVEAQSIVSYQNTVRVQRSYQAAMFNWLVSDVEPTVYSYLYGDSPSNFLGYRNLGVDAALDAGHRTGDAAARQSAYTELARQVAQDVPLWPYQEGRVTVYHGKAVAGVLLSNDGVLMMDRLGRRA